MEWDISFISKENFYAHVENTIKKYGDKLQSIDVDQFNRNIVDPIKLIFDNIVYGNTWKETISREIFRQRDKSNNNDIGYFHQHMFKYFNNCEVPQEGWDVILNCPNGITMENGTVVHTIYVEMKNKHNTMNSTSSAKTYIKMQNQLLNDDDCACFLVEAIAKKSQNTKWETTVDGQRMSHNLIRRVSIDKFYEIVIGEEDAFYKICTKLPTAIEEIMSNSESIVTPHDTVYEDLLNSVNNNDKALAMAIYMLGFSTYLGFNNDN